MSESQRSILGQLTEECVTLCNSYDVMIANKHFANGQWRACQESLQRVLHRSKTKSETTAAALNNHALCSAMSGDFDGAVEVWNALCLEYPDVPIIVNNASIARRVLHARALALVPPKIWRKSLLISSPSLSAPTHLRPNESLEHETGEGTESTTTTTGANNSAVVSIGLVADDDNVDDAGGGDSVSVIPSFPPEQLRAPGPYPDGIDVRQRENYLSDADFAEGFGMSKSDFSRLPQWRQKALKRSLGYF